MPKVTGRRTCPIGVVESSATPEKGLVGWSYSYGTWRLSNVLTDRMLNPSPPSMRVLVTCTLLMTGEHNMGRAPAAAAHLSWSAELKVMAHWDHLSGRVALSLGSTAFTSRANCLKMR